MHKKEKGIIVGSDLTQEWLLPWWWEHYSCSNTFPVAFVDFGMSFEAKEWCRKKGELIVLPEFFVAEKEEMEKGLVEEMEHSCGKVFWSSRHAWFKKPLACLSSFFERSIWIDLDCEVRSSLAPLFKLSCPIAMALEASHHQIKDYNTGVIVFNRDLSLLHEWKERCLQENHLFRGDQDVLRAIIHEKNVPITELFPLYNWSRFKGENEEAVIMHWHGPQGKMIIAHQMMRSSLRMFDCS